MPRYFFDTIDDGVLTTDTTGLVLPDREAARREAIRSLPYMAMDSLPDGSSRAFSVKVRDEAGARLFIAELSFTSRWLDRDPPDGT